jgi:hypothetical protein
MKIKLNNVDQWYWNVQTGKGAFPETKFVPQVSRDHPPAWDYSSKLTSLESSCKIQFVQEKCCIQKSTNSKLLPSVRKT